MAAKSGNPLNKLVQTSIIGNNILSKVEAIATENAETLKIVQEDVTEMRSSITVIKDLLTTQNKILLEIKSAIQMSGGSGGAATETAVGGLDAAGAGGAPPLPDMNLSNNLAMTFNGEKAAAGGSFGSIIAMAGAVALAATILGLISVSSPTEMLMKFGTALATVGVLMLMAQPFTKVMEILSGMKFSLSAEQSAGFEGMEAAVGGSVAGADIFGMMAAIGGSLWAMSAMAIGIVTASYILSLMPDPSGGLLMKLGLAVVVSMALVPAALAFSFALNALSKMKFEVSGNANALLAGAGGSASGADLPGMAAAIGGSFMSLVLMSVGIVMASYILSTMPSDPSLIQKAMIAGIVSLAMIPLAFAFGMLIKAMSFAGPNPATAAIAVAGAAIALPLMMGGIGLGIRALNATMPDTYPMLPDWEWLGKFSLIALMAGVVFYAIGQVVKGMGFKDLIVAGLAIPVAFAGLALGIRAWSMFAPSEADYSSPMDPIWAWKMGLSLLAFTLPIFVLGKIGPQGVLVGTIGLVLLMGAIGAGLWLFNAVAPDNVEEVAAKISVSLMQPFYAIVDFISYFVEKIPVEQAGAIAMALLKVGAGYAAFVLAVQGSSGIGNMLGGALNFVGNIFDGLSKGLGGEAQQKATDILLLLANNATKIKGLGGPLKDIGAAFAGIAAVNQTALDKAKTFLIKLDEHNYKKQAAQLERIAASFKGISDATNSMNIEAINATDELFKTINESILSGSIDTIDKMREMLVDILEGMADASKAMSGSGNMFEKGVKKLVGAADKDKESGAAANSETGGNNSELIEAINNLEMVLTGTLPVYVTNQEGY